MTIQNLKNKKLWKIFGILTVLNIEWIIISKEIIHYLPKLPGTSCHTVDLSKLSWQDILTKMPIIAGMEEIIFRLLPLAVWLKITKKTKKILLIGIIIISCAAFGYVHGNVYNIFMQRIGGANLFLLFLIIYDKKGLICGLGATIASHIIINLFLTLLGTYKTSGKVFSLKNYFSIVFPQRTSIKTPTLSIKLYALNIRMTRFIKRFLILIVLYHILITVIQYGIFGGSHPELPAILRDGIRFVFIFCSIIFYAKEFGAYLKKRKRPRICLIILVIFSVLVSYIKGKNISDMLIGIKYGFLYLPIFLSATFIGHILYKKDSNIQNSKFKIQNFLVFAKYFLVITLIAGFLWQISKFIRPNRFMTIGYGPFQDFVFGAKPPIYYLTGYQGTARRSGIFSGPNNYGYFLIAFLPLIIVLCKVKWQGLKKRFVDRKIMWNRIIIALWILAIMLTLSRTAAIGGIVALGLFNISRIKKHKKLARGVAGLVLLGLIGLSVLKGASTLGHIKAKCSSLLYVIKEPNGYGLGTSGPAVHHNGTILPENYFIQLMLDIGTIGFILRAMVIRQIQRISTKIKRFITDKNQLIYKARLALTIGWIAMLVMGLFLHVFEDSMINYSFFVLWGVISGYLLAKTRKEQY